MIIKYPSGGQWCLFLDQQVALIPLFHMRYDSLLNSEKQPVGRLRGWGTLVSTHLQYCTVYSVTLQLLVADQATVPNMKGEVPRYYMRYGSMICYKRLQSYSTGLYWVLLGSTDLPLHFGLSLQSLEGYQATIYQVKGDIHSFHLR